ncbi:hypothetical protein ONZ51_g8798 [Trametes cubensis]|uniref:Uncharacterized protein n=1 Tax=Trametes cubensis TaxID=1111947 RepID=A0AAD7X8C2_9APHY|nr:hypothetical protein ONZ51_g8798 [Trametes cubensis]
MLPGRTRVIADRLPADAGRLDALRLSRRLRFTAHAELRLSSSSRERRLFLQDPDAVTIPGRSGNPGWIFRQANVRKREMRHALRKEDDVDLMRAA